ncbi:TraB/GumN family protein [Aestuariibius insulae]|uniref:TraB/GumN family protein n=1 Tax=Aestuariibius insulae TaxID=2058287 RepID=UPI00345E0A77
MIRTLLTAATVVVTLATTADAACSGPGFTETLPAETRERIDTAAAQTPYGEGRLWQATRGDKTLTIVGTLHLPDPRHEPLLVQIETRMETTDFLLLEADAEEERRMSEAFVTNPEIMTMPGPSLPERMSEEDWQYLSEEMSKRGIAPMMGSRFQPWFLSLMLSVAPCAMQDLIGGAPGLDKEIEALATDANVPTASLESFDTIFTLFDTIPLEEQIDQLLVTIYPEDLAASMHISMLNDYFDGYVSRIWETAVVAIERLPGLTPEEREASLAMVELLLIEQRNRAWIPVIEEAAVEHDHVMIAAGALHLPGEIGVLYLLEQNGWTLENLAR